MTRHGAVIGQLCFLEAGKHELCQVPFCIHPDAGPESCYAAPLCIHLAANVHGEICFCRSQPSHTLRAPVLLLPGTARAAGVLRTAIRRWHS
jgi:hypothetical protein